MKKKRPLAEDGKQHPREEKHVMNRKNKCKIWC